MTGKRMEQKTDGAGLSYRDAGVDIEAGNQTVEKIREAVRSTYRPEVLGDLGGFGGLFALDKSAYEEPVLVSGTDGVGTKLKIAFMMNRHDTIGQDLVAMCVNDVLAQGAEPLFFLDYLAVGRLDPNQAAEVISGVAAACREAGCALIGGETAEMAGFYQSGEYDLAGFCVGVAERSQLLPKMESMAAGDVVLGLPSSGLHSNGFSLVRKICFERMGFGVDQHIEELGGPLGEELLIPTRIYSEIGLSLLENFSIKGLVHITGGGFQENLPRVLPEGLSIRVTPGGWVVPPIFELLQKWGGVSDEEMFRTFNMGIGLAMIVPRHEVGTIIGSLSLMGEKVYQLGQLEEGSRRVIFEGASDHD